MNCPYCKHNGFILIDYLDSPIPYKVLAPCEECKGTGEIEDKEETKQEDSVQRLDFRRKKE